MRAARLGLLVVTLAVVGCRREESEPDRPSKPSSPKKASTSTASAAHPPAASDEPAGPRYLRPDDKGALVDAFQFPSVPASIVEKQVAKVSSRRDAAGVLKRFGLPALDGSTGEAWMAKASLVDELERERVLVVTFRRDRDATGARDESVWIVFLGSTDDDRVLKVGNAKITARTAEATPIEIDARELHSGSVADVVATWSSCVDPSQKACHGMKAWTMQRGHPELVLDVVGDTAPRITGGSAPHDVVVDGKVLRFDDEAFAYR